MGASFFFFWDYHIKKIAICQERGITDFSAVCGSDAAQSYRFQ
jgi:hypothetical protein